MDANVISGVIGSLLMGFVALFLRWMNLRVSTSEADIEDKREDTRQIEFLRQLVIGLQEEVVIERAARKELEQRVHELEARVEELEGEKADLLQQISLTEGLS